MKEFKPKYISTNTGELEDNIINIIKATIKNFKYHRIITRWEVLKEQNK